MLEKLKTFEGREEIMEKIRADYDKAWETTSFKIAEAIILLLFFLL